MTAYLGTSEVRTLIVPATPQPDMAVAANYERFDGLIPLDNNPGGVPFGDDVYGHAPRDSGQTPISEQVFTHAVNGGLVNTLGGQPLPVRQWSGTPGGRTFTPAGSKLIGGPKMGHQMTTGIAETVFFGELQQSPPVPGDLLSIISGQA